MIVDTSKLKKKILDGKIAIIPTDTIYGIVGSALNEDTVENIYEIKGRKPEKPFIVLISLLKDLSLFGVSLNQLQRKFLNRVWPGPVSVILPCADKKFKYLNRGTKTLAFRIPNDKALINLLGKTGPLVAPSANPEGKEPAKNIKEAKSYFREKVDLYVDGGEIVSEPSALVDLAGQNPRVLRGSID